MFGHARVKAWIALVFGASLGFAPAFPAFATASDSVVWENHMQAAVAAHRRSAFHAAERRLRAAQETATAFETDDPRITETMMALSAVLFDQNRYAEAETLLQQTLEKRQAAFGDGDRRVAITHNALGLVRARDNRSAAAIPEFRTALEILDTNGDPPDALLEQVLDNYTGVLVAEGHYAEAEPHLRRLITQREKRLGENHPDTGQALESYAALLRLTGRRDEAIELEKRADKILKR